VRNSKLNIGYVIILAVLTLCQSSVEGQDFDSLLSAIDKIEASLEALGGNKTSVSQPRTGHRTTESNQVLRSQTGYADSTRCAQIAQDLQALRVEVAELKSEFQALQQPNNETTMSQHDVVVLLEELAILRAEIESSLEYQGSAQLASTELITAPTQEKDVAETSGGLEIGGFFDVVGSSRSTDSDEAPFRLGQAEIDLANQLSGRVAVEAAVAYNNEEGVFELGAAFIDLHLLNHEVNERHTRTNLGVDHSFILVGQFDVPFGIDYHTYASVDRKLVTTPIVVELTHGGWNDCGLQFGLDAPHANLVGYWVNGFESSAEIIDEVQTLATGVEVYEEVNTTPTNALGARLGLRPFDWLELGGSFAAGWNGSEKNEMTLAGLDLQLTYDKLEFKSELIGHSLNRTIAEENNRGYYVQGLYNLFERAFVVGRYGSFKPDQREWYGQGAIGLGYTLAEGVELRCESSIYENGADNQNIVQLVASF